MSNSFDALDCFFLAKSYTAKMNGCIQKSVGEILRKHGLICSVRYLTILGRPRITTKRKDSFISQNKLKGSI